MGIEPSSCRRRSAELTEVIVRSQTIIALVGCGGIFAVLLAVACGGSSSETPWPVEPTDIDPGPSGEKLREGNVVDVRALPTAERYRDAGAPAKP